MQRSLRVVVLAGLALNAWMVVLLSFGTLPAGGFEPTWRSMLAVVAFIAAPAMTFVPLGRVMHARLYGLEAIGGWAALLFVLAFVVPGESLSLPEFLAVTTPLTVALAAVLTPVAFLCLRSRVTRRSRATCALIARRQGYFAALGTVSMLLLAGIGVLNLYNAALIVVILGVIEFLLLDRAGILRPARS
jgi:hypothetical protein